MTKDQAIQQGYAAQITEVDNVAADFSQRVCPDPTVIEFTSSHGFFDAAGYEYTITAFYYQDKGTIDALPDGDLGELDWVATNYEIQIGA